jgi:hypothetical protein
MLGLKKYKHLGKKKDRGSLSPSSPSNSVHLSNKLNSDVELSPFSQKSLDDSKPENQGININQYFNRNRSDNDF